MSSTKIGYLGLGNMGSVLSVSIADYAKEYGLPPLVVWNRSETKFTAIKDSLNGGKYASCVADVLKECDVVFSCLANDQAVDDVYAQVVKELEASKKVVVFVDQSTIKPITSSKLAATQKVE